MGKISYERLQIKDRWNTGMNTYKNSATHRVLFAVTHRNIADA